MSLTGRPARVRSVWMGVCLTVALAHALNAHSDDSRAVTALVINDTSAGDTIVFHLGGATWIPVEALRDEGVQTSGGTERTFDGRSFVSLESLAPDISYQFDEIDVVLRLRVAPKRFAAREVRLSSARPVGLQRARNASGFLNYAVTGAETGASVATEAAINLRGLLLHGSLSRDERGALLRGPVSLTVDDERRLRRWEIGDASLSGGPFGGLLPIAGVVLSRHFAIDPYFVQYTPLQMTGSASTPSVADVYVNGQLVRRVPIAPGSFTIRDLPVSVGAGQAEVVVRDAFGREQRIGSTFYTPASVLRPGLHEYQYGVGVQRAAVGYRLWDYDDPVATGEHRVGVRDGLTIGGRVEASRSLVGLGPSVAARLPIGEMEALAAASRADGRTGGAGLIAWSYHGRAINGALSWRGTTRDYSTLGERLRVQSLRALDALSRGDDETPRGTGSGLLTAAGRVPSVRSDAQASIGWSVSRRLNLSAYYARLRYWGGWTAGDGRAIESREERALVGASWQAGSRIGVSATAGRSRSAGQVRREVFVGLNLFLGERLTASAGVNVDSSQTGRGVGAAGRGTSGVNLALQRSLPMGPGYAYRLQWQPDGRGASVDLRAQGGPGRVELRSDHLGGGGLTTASVMGALAMIGGRVYTTRPIDDAFALVRVRDVPGVRAFASNQYIGRTDRRGDVLIPHLVSYYGNRLSIASEDVPLTTDITSTEHLIAPSLRGGALVSFIAVARHPVIGRLVLGDDARVPALGEARTMGMREAEVSPLGREGEFYFERLPPGPNRVSVRFDLWWYECRIVVPEEVDPTGRPIDLGVITCRETLTRTEADAR